MTASPAPTARLLDFEEFVETVSSLGSYAFQPSPSAEDPTERVESLRRRTEARAFGVEADGRIQSVAVTTPMTQNLRGRLFPAGGVWGVATHPAYRRQGMCRAAMSALLQDRYQAGEVFSNLYPFRESFYARMGYLGWPQPRRSSFDPAALAALLTQALPGNVERHNLVDVLDDYRAYLAQRRVLTHGMAFFNTADPEASRKRPVWAAFVRRDGAVTGAMLYNVMGENITEFTLRIHRFFYDTPLDRQHLLTWCARHLDQANKIEIALPPSEYLETWYPDLKLKIEPFFVIPMNRVIDVARLEDLPSGPGTFRARVEDPLCPWNNAVWEFRGEDGVLHVQPALLADYTLTIQGLSALVAGVNDPAEFSLRGWGDPPVEAQAVLRGMFSRQIPYLHELF